MTHVVCLLVEHVKDERSLDHHLAGHVYKSQRGVYVRGKGDLALARLRHERNTIHSVITRQYDAI